MSFPSTSSIKESDVWKGQVKKMDSDLVEKFTKLVSLKSEEYIQAKRYDSRRAQQEYKLTKLSYKNEDDCKLLNIFPEEVWTMILGHIKNKKDLRYCEISCQLFCRILHDYKKQWMFSEIAHLVQQYLTKTDFLTSRLVCKEWRHGVDTFFENVRDYGVKHQHWSRSTAIEQVPNHWKNVTPQFEQVYNIPITPTMEEGLGATHLFLGTMDHHQNPFIGRSVRIYSRLDLNPNIQALLLPSYNRSFEKFGVYIRHLSVTFAGFTETPVVVSPFSFCATVLNGSPNLKSFSLDVVGSLSYVLNKHEDDNVSFPNHECLEFLKLGNRANFGELLTKLVETYHSQLKHVELFLGDFNSQSYLTWNELTALEVNTYTASCGLVQKFGMFAAPNLRSLTIGWWKSCESMHELMKLVKRFPKLEFLKLVGCTDLLNFSDMEVFNLPDDLCCTVSVKELQMDCVKLKNTTFQFLRCFPLLKKFAIWHDWENWQVDKSNSFLSPAEAVIEPEYLYGDQENYNENSPLMLKSNIWKALPNLVRLENFDMMQGTRRAYTRKSYQLFNLAHFSYLT